MLFILFELINWLTSLNLNKGRYLFMQVNPLDPKEQGLLDLL